MLDCQLIPLLSVLGTEAGESQVLDLLGLHSVTLSQKTKPTTFVRGKEQGLVLCLLLVCVGDTQRARLWLCLMVNVIISSGCFSTQGQGTWGQASKKGQGFPEQMSYAFGKMGRRYLGRRMFSKHTAISVQLGNGDKNLTRSRKWQELACSVGRWWVGAAVGGQTMKPCFASFHAESWSCPGADKVSVLEHSVTRMHMAAVFRQ